MLNRNRANEASKHRTSFIWYAVPLIRCFQIDLPQTPDRRRRPRRDSNTVTDDNHDGGGTKRRQRRHRTKRRQRRHQASTLAKPYITVDVAVTACLRRRQHNCQNKHNFIRSRATYLRLSRIYKMANIMTSPEWLSTRLWR